MDARLSFCFYTVLMEVRLELGLIGGLLLYLLSAFQSIDSRALFY